MEGWGLDRPNNAYLIDSKGFLSVLLNVDFQFADEATQRVVES